MRQPGYLNTILSSLISLVQSGLFPHLHPRVLFRYFVSVIHGMFLCSLVDWEAGRERSWGGEVEEEVLGTVPRARASTGKTRLNLFE